MSWYVHESHEAYNDNLLIVTDEGQVIADVGFERYECRSNAQKLAAAPDMLAALEMLSNALDVAGSVEQWQLDIARKAITKAKGE